jgi:hypothetical protein
MFQARRVTIWLEEIFHCSPMNINTILHGIVMLLLCYYFDVRLV